ncbi:carbohydrate kinase family protein [Maribacter sp. 2307ULW6-5]|uniref:carbohydrate kinase family protein n=1 Tax=Maribacter sp. 2307ULW6-5 TaxID=3386275 RepID=UPI0039BC36FE
MKKVFCIGEVLIDFVAENQGGDLSKAKTFTKKAGGAPANVACAIAKLGGRAHFLGAVGKDPFGHYLFNVLKTERVALELAQQTDNTFTTLAFVSLDKNGERDFVFSRGADREYAYDPKVKSHFEHNMVHFGAATAMLGGHLEDAYNRYLFDALTHKAFLSFDPNYRADLWKKREDSFKKKCMPFLEKCHLSKFSLEEAKLLSGKEDLKDACAFFHELGTEIVVITLGEQGTLLSTQNISVTVPSIKVNTVDTTGAGDAFMGCLLKQLADQDSLLDIARQGDFLTQAVARANRAGAITTTNFGAIASLPTPQQLNEVS